MARRDLEEINAGSMADIAFLLLIFFLVTTTMEVDAGISRMLPYKRELPPDYIPPSVNDRNILVIMANSKDELFVEGEYMLLENLEDKVRLFYTANRGGVDLDVTMPEYMVVNEQLCNQKIAELKATIAVSNPDLVEKILQPDLAKWEKRKTTCLRLGGSYNEISSQAVIQLKNQASTTYGLYVQIQNILKKVVNDLREEECQRRWNVSYFDLDEAEEGDLEKLQMLELLVPERIIESKIEV